MRGPGNQTFRYCVHLKRIAMGRESYFLERMHWLQNTITELRMQYSRHAANSFGIKHIKPAALQRHGIPALTWGESIFVPPACGAIYRVWLACGNCATVYFSASSGLPKARYRSAR
jgi:hypothetical protein